MILEGIRVLDFTQYLAGPTVTRLMAEMGAEIIKIEHAPSGDPARGLPFIKDGRSGYFVQQNRGKQSVCLDLSKPASKESWLLPFRLKAASEGLSSPLTVSKNPPA